MIAVTYSPSILLRERETLLQSISSHILYSIPFLQIVFIYHKDSVSKVLIALVCLFLSYSHKIIKIFVLQKLKYVLLNIVIDNMILYCRI